MIHATPFGYPPRTQAERHQDDAEACMAAEDAFVMAARFSEAPVDYIQQQRRDAVQAIIGQCLEAKAEYERACREDDMELESGAGNALQVVMAQAQYIGFANETFKRILEECKRLT